MNLEIGKKYKIVGPALVELDVELTSFKGSECRGTVKTKGHLEGIPDYWFLAESIKI